MDDCGLRKEWLTRRKGGLGGSDMPVILLGEVYGRNALDVYLDKVGEHIDDTQNTAMERGAKLEPIIAQKFREETGIDLVIPETQEDRYFNFWVDHAELDWMYANLDGIIGNGSREISEIKCPGVAKFQEVKDNGLTPEYQIQGQSQMAVSDTDVVHFIIFCAEYWKYLHIPLERDEATIQMIIERGGEFWENNVVKRIPPPVDLLKQNAPTMKTVGGDYVDCTEYEAFVDLFGWLTETTKKLAAAKEDDAEARDALNALMNDLDEDKIMVGKWKASRYYSSSSSLDVKALQAAHPEIDIKKFYRKKWSDEKTLTVYKPRNL